MSDFCIDMLRRYFKGFMFNNIRIRCIIKCWVCFNRSKSCYIVCKWSIYYHINRRVGFSKERSVWVVRSSMFWEIRCSEHACVNDRLLPHFHPLTHGITRFVAVSFTDMHIQGYTHLLVGAIHVRSMNDIISGHASNVVFVLTERAQVHTLSQLVLTEPLYILYHSKRHSTQFK